MFAASVQNGKITQIIIVALCTIGTIGDGMQVGWTASLIFLLDSNTTSTTFNKSKIVWMETYFQIGGLIVLPLISLLLNRIGRRRTIIAGNIFGITGWCIMALTSRLPFIYLARIFTGAGSDIYAISVQTYVSEISHKSIRGFLVSFMYIMMMFGTLLIYVIGPYLTTLLVCCIGIGCILTTLVSVNFMPESPYFLLLKNRPEPAKKSLLRLRGPNAQVDQELVDITNLIEEQENHRLSFPDLFLNRNNRRAVFITVILSAGMSVNNVIVMNLHEILTAAKSTYFNAYYTAIVFSILFLLASVAGSLLVDRLGRRFLLVASAFLTGLCFIILGLFFQLQTHLHNYSWIPTAALMLYAVVFRFGLGQITFVVVSEVLATKVKADGLTFASGVYLGLSLVNIQIYNQFLSLWGFHVPFYIFAVLSLTVAVLTMIVLPETKGKTLQEIQEPKMNRTEQ